MKNQIFSMLGASVLAAGCVSDGRSTRADRVVGDDAMVGSNSRREVVVTRRIPAARTERVTVSPNPNYVWIKGHWSWQDNDWVWMAGRWAERPRPGAVWREGEFLQQGYRMIWQPGHWTNRWAAGA